MSKTEQCAALAIELLRKRGPQRSTWIVGELRARGFGMKVIRRARIRAKISISGNTSAAVWFIGDGQDIKNARFNVKFLPRRERLSWRDSREVDACVSAILRILRKNGGSMSGRSALAELRASGFTDDGLLYGARKKATKKNLIKVDGFSMRSQWSLSDGRLDPGIIAEARERARLNKQASRTFARNNRITEPQPPRSPAEQYHTRSASRPIPRILRCFCCGEETTMRLTTASRRPCCADCQRSFDERA